MTYCSAKVEKIHLWIKDIEGTRDNSIIHGRNRWLLTKYNINYEKLEKTDRVPCDFEGCTGTFLNHSSMPRHKRNRHTQSSIRSRFCSFLFCLKAR